LVLEVFFASRNLLRIVAAWRKGILEDSVMKMAWITWESQVRNRSLSRSVGAELFELAEDKPRLLRYFLLTLKTIPILFRKKYKVIFTQNPSIFLSLLNVLAAKITGKIAIVDAHNSGIYPASGKHRALTVLNDFVLRNANCVIVSNSALATAILEKKGKPVVLPDPIPLIEQGVAIGLPEGANLSFLFICSWADDEPFMEVIEAARSLPHYSLYVTGKYQKRLSPEFVSRLPDNITLTGYIPDRDYEQLLQRVDVAIDLTTRENCMVCGAYEAAATGTPAILSDHVVNRSYFKPGYIFTRNDKQGIAAAMQEAEGSIATLKVDIKHFSEQAKDAWEKDKDCFLAELASTVGEVPADLSGLGG
jgi:glycosyltransferase involved in cell wall biosynthesis